MATTALLGLEAPDHFDLLLRQTLGPILHTELGRQGARDAFVVPGQQQHTSDSERPELPQGLGDLGADGVGDGHETQELVVFGQVHHGASLRLEGLRPIDSRRRDLDGLPLHQSHASARNGVPANACHDAFPRHRVEPFGCGPGETPGLGLRQHRSGDRVLGVPLGQRPLWRAPRSHSGDRA
jgi:hypothetical protein